MDEAALTSKGGTGPNLAKLGRNKNYWSIGSSRKRLQDFKICCSWATVWANAVSLRLKEYIHLFAATMRIPSFMGTKTDYNSLASLYITIDPQSVSTLKALVIPNNMSPGLTISLFFDDMSMILYPNTINTRIFDPFATQPPKLGKFSANP